MFLISEKKAIGDEDAAGDVLKQLGEDGLKLMTQLINNTYETREGQGFQ